MTRAEAALPAEFGLIARHFAGHDAGPGVVLGVGDDAAIVTPPPDESLVLTVDTLAEGRHFPPDAPPDAIGHRALAVSLSDIAAMGATPAWALLALTLPDAREAWVADFARGFLELAAGHGVALVGGNVSGGALAATVTVIGHVGAGQALRRAGARAGDRLYVSGSPGEAAGGLATWGTVAVTDDRGGGAGDTPARADALAALRGRYLRPAPRVALGCALRGIASAAIDVSDGLLADLGHVCRASGVGARVELSALPGSAALAACFDADAREALVLHGGDDYELLCAIPPGVEADARDAAARAGCAFTAIGEFTAGDGIRVTRDGTPVDIPDRGFRHFD